MTDPLLRIEDLTVSFRTPKGKARVLAGVSLTIEQGKILGLVGESGCGKSMTALSILRLIPEPAGSIESGRLLWKGKDLLSIPEDEMRRIRGGEISMVFQEPMTSLNPVFTVGEQIAEAVRLHQSLSRDAAEVQTHEVMRQVGFPDPPSQARRYPHELSGGMRQRALMAMALSCEPALLIADEPTTALDVTIQAQILDLLRSIQKERSLSLLFITHDLGIIAQLADEVAVMYAGQVVETASVRDLFAAPAHPYTRGLLHSLPKMDHLRERLTSIPGTVPQPWDRPEGCPFHPRCGYAQSICRTSQPAAKPLGHGHEARCHFAGVL